MSERNKRRHVIRMLQQNPTLDFHKDIKHSVPAVIPDGTIVTALSRRYRIIQRGVVLSYDKYRARYLVLFENKSYGSEYCPDSEVATHGGPQILFQSPPAALNHLPGDWSGPKGVAPVGSANILDIGAYESSAVYVAY